MKIRIINKDCGLEINKVYDLCEVSATTLIETGKAVRLEYVKQDKNAVQHNNTGSR